MIKRTLMLIMFIVSLLAMSVTCYAKITVEDLNIGGIYYGQPASDVVKKLGNPTRMQVTPPAGSSPVFKLGNSEVLVKYVWNKDIQLVWGVSILSGNGASTAAGIGIGSNYEDVIKAYGKADYDSVLTHSGLQRYAVSYKIPNIEQGTGASLDFAIGSDKKVIGISFGTYEYEG